MATVTDIRSLIYVFKAVRPALKRRRLDKMHMILQVDDIGEHRIIDRAEVFLKAYNGDESLSLVDQRSVIIGLFLLHRTSMAHLAHGKALYVHAPLDKLFFDRATGKSITVMKMISLTYGALPTVPYLRCKDCESGAVGLFPERSLHRSN